MKTKIFTVLFVLFCYATSYSQVYYGGGKNYAGFGLSFDVFTNPEVSNYYNGAPSNNALYVTDITFTLGRNLNKHFAVEFAPSLIFTPSSVYGGGSFDYWDDDPYWWYDDSPTANQSSNTYNLTNASLFAIPLNLRVKYFPLNSSNSLYGSGLNLNLSLGAMYIYESFTGTGGPTGSSLNQPFNISSSTWAPDAVIGLGYTYSYNSALLLGFNANYRFVPMSLNRKSPLTIANSGNYNSLNFDFSIGFGY